MTTSTSSKNTADHDLAAERRSALQELQADPFVGYGTLEEAFEDCRCTPQAEVLAHLFMRKNVFISGPAGSGKSYLIQRFIKHLDAEYGGKYNVAITASTGAAAQIIGGQTIHSWSGVGTGTEPFDRGRLTPMERNAKRRIVDTDILVIDEISMLPSYLFEKLDLLLKHHRRSALPFGGVQIIAMGDFLQLPPVPGRDEDGNYIPTDFAVFTEAWKNADFHYSYMDKSRRATDKRLKYALTHIANDKVTDRVRQLIESRIGGEEMMQKDKLYAKLFTTNRGVDEYNKRMYDLNANKQRLMRARRSTNGAEHHDTIIKRNGIQEEIPLKNDTVVILTKNLPEYGLVNGSIGVVKKITNEVVVVKFNSRDDDTAILRHTYSMEKKFEVLDPEEGETYLLSQPISSVEQFPLKHGYAISVHKSQGQTFDGVMTDLSNIFSSGLGYVALSRVRDLDDLVITGFSPKAYKMDERSLKITQSVKRRAMKSRVESLNKIDEVSAVLNNEMVRGVYWNDK